MVSKLKFWQAVVFVLSFLCMSARHAGLTGYYMVKPYFQEDLGFSNAWLGLFDFSYLACYAAGNFVGGMLADKYAARKVISITLLVLSGVYGIIILCGFLHVTNPWIYFILFALNGSFHSPVWPSTVSLIGNWFPKSSRGSIMGLWSSNNSIGNILGQQTAAILEESTSLSWEYVLLMTTAYIFISSLLILFVKDKPSTLLLSSQNLPLSSSLNSEDSIPIKSGISFKEACNLPGVKIYALNFACVKLLEYGMMMWLPFFATVVVGISGLMKGTLVSLFDIGGVVGSILFGWMSDKFETRTLVILGMLFMSVPVFIAFREVDNTDEWIFFLLSPMCGMLIGGAANLIASTVAADLAQNEKVKGNQEAISTVTGIINGTGGIGAALGQVVIGLLSGISWSLTFAFLVLISVISFSLLVPLAIKEYRLLRARRLESMVCLPVS